MKILCLYKNDCAIELFNWLERNGHTVVLWKEKLEESWCREQKFDLIVNYTYGFILTESVLKTLNYNAVNIYNSYLPWNRWADPNIWGILDDTPRGVTLHYMEPELDKGAIIAQKMVCDGEQGTLKSSYDNLDRAAKELFKETFKFYQYWTEMKKRSIFKGNYHSIKDGKVIYSVIDTYDLPVFELKKGLTNYVGGGENRVSYFENDEVCAA